MNLARSSNPTGNRRRPLLLTLLLATIALVGGLVAGGLGAALAAPESGSYVPPADTILEVEGDKLHGFTVYRYDGSTVSPPTDSEAKAECREYDELVDRVRCRTEVRVWFRDLLQTKRALNYAQSRQ